MRVKSNILLFGFTLAFMVFLATVTIFPIEDSDIWWHLRAGELILKNKALFKTDPFSYALPNLAFPDWEWLSQVVFAFFWQHWQASGVVIFKAVVILATFALLILAMVKLDRLSFLGTGALILIVLASADRFLARPEHVSNLFFVLTLVILYSTRMKANEKRMRTNERMLFLLPFLFVLWVNFHPGVILGLGLLLLFAFSETLRYFLAKRDIWQSEFVIEFARLKKLWLIFILCSLASLVNPYSYKAIILPLEHLGERLYMSKIYEWMPIFSYEHQQMIYVFAFKILFVLYLAAFCLNIKKLDLTSFLLTLGLASQAVLHVRNIPLFALGGFFPFLVNLKQMPFSFSGTSKIFKLEKGLLVLLALSLFFTSFRFYQHGYTLGRTKRAVGLGKKEIFPDRALQFLDEVETKGNMFNCYGAGGYIIFKSYPKRRVFIDGRAYIYPEEFYQEYLAVADSADKLTEIADKYNINYFLLLHPEPQLGLAQPQYYLTDSDDWILVYWDNYYLVYLRKAEENYPTVEKYNYFYADPVKLSEPEYLKWFTGQGEAANLARMRTVGELNRNLEMVPNNARAHILLGGIYETIPSPSTAEEEYRKAVELQPDSAQAHALLGGVLLKLGKLGEAKKELLLAVKYEPLLPEAYMNLGLVAQNQKRPDQAEKYYQKTLKINPQLANAYLALGYLYLGEDKTEEAKQAFAKFLELQPEGAEAEKVREILLDLGLGKQIPKIQFPK